MSKLNEICMKLVPNETHFSFDKSMVLYFGRHGCKQYIRGREFGLAIGFGVVQNVWATFAGLSRIRV